MIEIVIEGIPVPWAAHGGYGRKSFNPRFKEKEYYQWKIRQQWKTSPIPKPTPISIAYSFHMPIPKSASKKKFAKMLDGTIKHTTTPDTTNMVKFLEDCLKTICFEDDSQVYDFTATKFYALAPKTVVLIQFH